MATVTLTKNSGNTTIETVDNGGLNTITITESASVSYRDDKIYVKAINGDVLASFKYSEVVDKLSTTTVDSFVDALTDNNYFVFSSGGGSTTTNAADLTSGVLADARVQESNVTQHEDALSIATSQLFGTLITSESDNFAFETSTGQRLLRFIDFPTAWLPDAETSFFQFGRPSALFTANNGARMDQVGFFTNGVTIANNSFQDLPTPTAMLDVRGDVKATSFEGAGDDLTGVVKNSTTGEPTGSDSVLNVVSLTQAEYDAGTPVATTLYVITDA